jgi:hypothetical protein
LKREERREKREERGEKREEGRGKRGILPARLGS